MRIVEIPGGDICACCGTHVETTGAVSYTHLEDFGFTDNKKEGDGATPSGGYSFDLAFGLLDDPGSVLPYHKIVKGDFWVDDPASPHYNQLVNDKTTAKDWNSGENLIKATPYYN